MTTWLEDQLETATPTCRRCVREYPPVLQDDIADDVVLKVPSTVVNFLADLARESDRSLSEVLDAVLAEAVTRTASPATSGDVRLRFIAVHERLLQELWQEPDATWRPFVETEYIEVALDGETLEYVDVVAETLTAARETVIVAMLLQRPDAAPAADCVAPSTCSPTWPPLSASDRRTATDAFVRIYDDHQSARGRTRRHYVTMPNDVYAVLSTAAKDSGCDPAVLFEIVVVQAMLHASRSIVQLAANLAASFDPPEAMTTQFRLSHELAAADRAFRENARARPGAFLAAFVAVFALDVLHSMSLSEHKRL